MYNKGIIISSACIANPIGHLILLDREDEALEVAKRNGASAPGFNSKNLSIKSDTDTNHSQDETIVEIQTPQVFPADAFQVIDKAIATAIELFNSEGNNNEN